MSTEISGVLPSAGNPDSLMQGFENLSPQDRVSQLWNFSVRTGEQVKLLGDKMFVAGSDFLGDAIHFMQEQKSFEFIFSGLVLALVGHELHKRLPDDRKSKYNIFGLGNVDDPAGTIKGQLYFMPFLSPVFIQLAGTISDSLTKSDVPAALSSAWTTFTAPGNINLHAIIYLTYIFTQKGIMVNEGRKQKGMTWGELLKETGSSIVNDFASLPGKLLKIPVAAREKILAMAKSMQNGNQEELYAEVSDTSDLGIPAPVDRSGLENMDIE